MAELEGQLADAQSQRATAVADLSAVQAERDAAQVFFVFFTRRVSVLLPSQPWVRCRRGVTRRWSVPAAAVTPFRV